MKLLLKPIIWQLGGLGVLLVAAFVFGFAIIRKLRKEIATEMQPFVETQRAEVPSFATAALQGVIANLKQREAQLNSQLQLQANRIASLESMSNAILDNLPTGVLLFSPNLLVQQANVAAKSLLGYASPLQMHVKEVFRGLQSIHISEEDESIEGLIRAVREVLTKGSSFRDVSAFYRPPSGDANEFQITLVPVSGTGNQVTAALCLVSRAFTLSLPALEAASTVLKAE